MSDKPKRILWHAARLLVAAGLVAYVLSQASLYDSVRPEPGAPALRVLMEGPEGVTVARPEGGERLIRTGEFRSDERPDGAVRIAGLITIGSRLAGHWGWVLAAMAAMMLQSPVGAIRWKLLLAVQGIHITFLESLRLTYIGWFFSNWLPGSMGGDFVKAYYIASQTHRKAEAVTVVFLDRFIGLIAMCMLGAVAVLASLHDERVRTAQVLVGLFLAAVAVGAVVFYSRRIRRVLHVDALLAKIPGGDTAAKVDRAIFLYRYHKRAVVAAMAYSWLTQVVSVLAVWWIGTGLGSLASWHHYFVVMPVIWIGWSLIPVPGGFGVAEAMAQELFRPSVLGGAPAEAATLALAMILAYRIVQMVVSAPGGVLYLARRTRVSPTHMRDEMEGPEAHA